MIISNKKVQQRSKSSKNYLIFITFRNGVVRWAFRVLSVNKDAQRQIQDEIDRVVGERDVTWEDRKR